MGTTAKTKPLISYYGGKQRIASKIVEEVWKIPHTVYVEPYAGGLAVLFAKGKKQVTTTAQYREVVNDIDDRLITMYRLARENPEEFNRWIQCTLYSQSEHRRSAEILKNPEQYSEMERAWAYYVNILQGFANTLFAGWGTGVWSRNVAATWHNKQKRLPDCLDRLSDVHIACELALNCIKRWDSPQTLFYLDPPYPSSDQGHYSGFTLEDWSELCNYLDSIQGSYILSNYTQPIEPKSCQRKVEISAVMSAKKTKGDHSSKQVRENTKRTEILWICDRSEGMRPELKKLFEYAN